MQLILEVTSPLLLLVGGFLLWYPTVRPEYGAGGWGGRANDWADKQARKSNPPKPVRMDDYPWTDTRFYFAGWSLIGMGTVIGVIGFLW